MKVVAYLSGVPSPHKNLNKIEVLTKYIKGINLVGDTGILHKGQNLIECDLGIIQGWVHEGSPLTPHLNLRKKVAHNTFNKNTLIIDSNLFNYLPDTKNLHYRRYSLNGIFPTTGNYFWNNPDPSRWKKIKKDLNINVKDWRSKGDHILICCQRNNGWSMKGLSVVNWLNQTLNRLKNLTNRPIIVRGHPGDRNSPSYLKNYPTTKNVNLIDDFKNAWCVITYNSSPAIAAAIEGIPVYVTDPNPNFSQAFEVANFDLNTIESPNLFERKKWLEKLAMCHWNFLEIESGAAWAHMKGYLNDNR